jgi:hypothetical protein
MKKRRHMERRTTTRIQPARHSTISPT